MHSKRILAGLAVLAATGALVMAGCSKSDQKAAQETSGAQPAQQGASAPVNHSSIIIDDLKAKLKEKPDDPELLQRLGDTYFELKQFKDAIVYYKKVLEVKPSEIDVYNDLGLSLHYMGNSAEGLKYIDEGLKKNQYHQRIWLTKGFILAYGMGDLSSARTAWEKARTINPESQIGKAASDFLAQFDKK